VSFFGYILIAIGFFIEIGNNLLQLSFVREVTSVTLDCPQDACGGKDTEKCKGCKASFCMLDFDAQKEDPEKIPTLTQ